MERGNVVTFEVVAWFVLIAAAAKLAGLVDWSWWVVLAPIWLPIALVFGLPLLIILLMVGYVAVLAVIGWWGSK